MNSLDHKILRGISQTLLLTLPLVLVGVALYLQKGESDNHLIYLEKIQTLEQFDARLNSQLLLNRKNPEQNYDTVSSTLRQYQTALNDFSHTFEQYSETLSQDFHGAMNQLSTVLQKKREATAQYKAKRSIFFNSITYLPELMQSHREYEADDSAVHQDGHQSALSAETHEIYDALLLHLASRPNQDPDYLIKQIDRLKQQLQKTPLEEGEEHQETVVAAKHLQLALHSLQQMDHHLMEALSAASREQIERLRHHYLASFQQIKQQNRVLNFGLMLTVIVLLIFVFRSGARIRTQVGELQQLRMAIDEHAIVSSADIYGNITYANPQFCEISGYPLEELIGKNHRLLKSGEHEPALYQTLWNTISKGEVWHGEIKNNTKDGGYYWVKATIVPFHDLDGNVTQYISMRTDITSQKELEEQLLQQQIELKKAAQSKSQFLANMSHEIRTPMNAIIGMSGLALQTDLDSKQHHYIDKVNRAAKGLLGILNDILDLSKLDAGRIEIESIPLSPHYLFEELHALFDIETEKKEIHFTTRIDPALPEVVIGDQLRLTQVLTNLCGNAIKFTPDSGTVQVMAKLQQCREDEVEILFSVQDSGIGISEAEQQHIFDTFSQADASTTRQFGGTGLGLTISRMLVRMMGGELELKSREGEGANFHFSLTLGIGETLLQDNKTETETIEQAAQQLRGASILVAEDNPDNQELIQELLMQADIEVTLANNGQEVLDLLEQGEHYDGILMDCMMPVMDGYSATRSIRQHSKWNKLPIIAVTARVSADERRRTLDCGMNDLVHKPINNSHLFTTMAEWITPESPLITEQHIQQSHSETRTLDLAVARPLLEALQLQLHEQGFDAIELCEQLQPLFSGTSYQSTFETIAHQTNDLNFELAHQLLGTLIAEIEESR